MWPRDWSSDVCSSDLAEAAGFPYWSHQPNRKIARFAASANGLLTRIEPDEVLDYPLPGRSEERRVGERVEGSEAAGSLDKNGEGTSMLVSLRGNARYQ